MLPGVGLGTARAEEAGWETLGFPRQAKEGQALCAEGSRAGAASR